jgi:DNA repair and recombination protein RAD52
MAAAAQQAQTPARAPATPPQRAPTHSHAHASTSGSGSGTIEAQANRGPPPVDAPKSNGLATPIQTPARAQHPAPPRAPLPRAFATSPLARIPSAPERSVSFAKVMPASARASSADAADQAMRHTDEGNGRGNDEDDDPFPLSTQDDAFLATVDLGEGDLGRPIDFDEGVVGVSMMDSSVLEPELDSAERSPVALPQPEPQVRDRVGSGPSAGSSSGGPSKMNTRNDAQAQPAAKPLSTSALQEIASGGQPQPPSRSPNSASASASTSSTSSTRAGPPARTSMGGFRIPPAMVRIIFVLDHNRASLTATPCLYARFSAPSISFIVSASRDRLCSTPQRLSYQHACERRRAPRRPPDRRTR